MKQLSDVSDPWEMGHFRERLKIYYRDELKDVDGNSIKRATIAGVLLNYLAAEEHPQSIDECLHDIKSKMRFQNRDDVAEILKSLAKDHYLTRDNEGRFLFRFPLVKKWWCYDQGLQP